MSPVEILPVEGLPDFRPGDDLAEAIAARAPWLRDDDILVVTSKIVSKAEGRLIPTGSDPGQREAARQQAITDEAVRVLASMGRMRIVETRHGLVITAAGVDASNVHRDEIALLPVDPDASARRLRAELADRLGVHVAVVVSDTASRPWRVGLTDHAIGVAGLQAVESLRGATDSHGNVLVVTERAVADEVAAAADLVKGKLTGIPVAVVRGLAPVDDPRGARPLIRPVDEDLFGLGVAEARAQGQRGAVAARRPAREFTDDPVDDAAVRRAIAAALTAPIPDYPAANHPAPRRPAPGEAVPEQAVPDGSGCDDAVPWRYAMLNRASVARLLDAMADGPTASDPAHQDAVAALRAAPSVVVPAVAAPAQGDCTPSLLDAVAGAGIASFLIALAAEGLGACWLAPPTLRSDLARAALDLDASWRLMGAVAIGHPADDLSPHPERALDDYVVSR